MGRKVSLKRKLTILINFCERPYAYLTYLWGDKPVRSVIKIFSYSFCNMPIKYNVKKTKVGFGTDKTEVYVGRIQLGSTISTDKLEEQVAVRTLLPQSVIHTVLNNIVDSVCHFVEEGQGVRIGELGILRPSISTKSAADDSEVSVEKVRLRWLPSVKVREAAAKFSIKKVSDSSSATDDTDDEETGGEDVDNGSSSGGGGGNEFS